jgi:hypothetical protein
MSPSTAEAPAAKAADVRQPTPSTKALSTTPPSTAAPAWPDTVANPRRTRVR